VSRAVEVLRQDPHLLFFETRAAVRWGTSSADRKDIERFTGRVAQRSYMRPPGGVKEGWPLRREGVRYTLKSRKTPSEEE